MTDIMTLHEPTGWRLYRLGQLFQERKEKVSDKDYPPLSVTMNGIVPQLETAAKTDDGDNRKLVQVGDYVINSRSDRKGSGGISSHSGSVSLISIVMRPKCIHPRFAHHLLRSRAFQEEFYRWGHGIVADLWTTRYADMKNIRLFLPDLETQRAIADFLDRETARIDQLIEKKRYFVSALDARQEGLARRLLSGETTESNLRQETFTPWLQSVPSDWKIVPLRHLVRISTGERDTQDRADDGEYPFYVRSMNVERINTYSFDEEAVLTSGDGAGVGKVFHHVDGKFELHQRMYAFTKFKEISGRYFFHYLKTFFHLQMTQWSAKSTVDSVRMPFLKNLLIAVPSTEEQLAILSQLDASQSRMQAIVGKTQKSIERLQEFRAAIIAAAVTGQIDVTAWGRKGMTDARLDAIEAEMGQGTTKRKEARA